jgi:predicted HNH restriction endonuclease
MNASLPLYAEYADSLAYIKDPQVQEAFVYLVDRSRHIPGYTARPKPHGYINRNLHYFDANDSSPYAFTVNQRWLLFYLRMPTQTHSGMSDVALRRTFPEFNRLKNGEITFKIRTVDEARAAMQLAFPGLGTESEYRSPDELPKGTTYVEGAASVIRVNNYERSLQARQACIHHYGCACAVCGFIFRDHYGELGQGYIHVHHLVELALIHDEYEVDPIRDLRPVCPNCHAMLHRREPALTIEELKLTLTGLTNGSYPTNQ